MLYAYCVILQIDCDVLATHMWIQMTAMFIQSQPQNIWNQTSPGRSKFQYLQAIPMIHIYIYKDSKHGRL